MKRAGFTMIELIFVIVILGILSAVALPKFIGVSEQAHVGKLKAYVGTLNRTIAPALWSKSLAESNGSIGNATYQGYLTSQITAPIEIDNNGTVTLSAATCGQSYPSGLVGTVDANKTQVQANPFATASSIGTLKYYIGCTDGNSTSSPLFFLEDQNGTILVK